MRRKMRSYPAAALPCAAATTVVALLGSAAHANTGTQLPLSQIQAGTEQTSPNLVVNPGFEQAGPSGWSAELGMTVGSPVNPPSNSAVVGSFSAQGGQDNAKFTQAVSLEPNTDYVLSGYIWNFGLPGPAPHNDLNPGDLAVVELVDTTNVFNTAGIILEPVALDDGDASQGYFLYETFNSSQFPSGAVLEVEVDWADFAGTRPTLVAQFDNIAVTPASMFMPPLPGGGGGSTWNVNGNGLWSAPGNWDGGVPDGVGAVATFGAIIQQPVTVTLDTPRTVGTVNFNNANKYTIAGTSTLTLDVASGSAGITVIDFGSHEISAPVQLNDNTDVVVALAGSSLRLSGQVSAAAGVTLTKGGPGLLEMRNVRTTGLNVDAGRLRVLSDGTSGGTSNVATLSVGSAAWLDVTNNAFVVDYTGATPFVEIRDEIAQSYNGGVWDAPGITSSSANANTVGIGYAEASDLATVPAVFGTVDATAVLFRLTRYGDANLDGTVNLADFNALAANFGTSGGAIWRQGDFTYDGIVNLNDFNRLAANFGLAAAGTEVTPQDWSNLAAAVPEPGTLGLIAFGVLPLARRRRAVRRA